MSTIQLPTETDSLKITEKSNILTETHNSRGSRQYWKVNLVNVYKMLIQWIKLRSRDNLIIIFKKSEFKVWVQQIIANFKEFHIMTKVHCGNCYNIFYSWEINHENLVDADWHGKPAGKTISHHHRKQYATVSVYQVPPLRPVAGVTDWRQLTTQGTQ